MSSFDPDSITDTQDVPLSLATRQALAALGGQLAELREQAQLAQAIEHISALLAQAKPDEHDTRDGAQQQKYWLGALLFLRADLYLDLGETDLALEDVDAALTHGWRTREAWELAGWANYAAERPAAARDQFDRALGRDPDRISSLMGRALALMELEDFAHARSDLTHAINLDGEDAELYALRSDVFVRTNHMEQAERDIQQARELDDEPDYALQHARILLAQERVAEAEAALDDALQQDDEVTLETLLLRSYLHLHEGRLQQARADAIRASSNFPDEAFAFVQLAHVQLTAHKVASALKAAERAVQLDPSLADAYMVRGGARHLHGQIDAARQDFEHAHQAPAELPILLFGPCYEATSARSMTQDMQQLFADFLKANPASPQSAPPAGAANQPAPEETPSAGSKKSSKKPTGAQHPRSPAGTASDASASRPAGAPPKPPGLGDFDPMSLLGELFDDSGRIKKRFKPFLEMAMKNAPSILKKMPPGLFPKMEGFDPKDLEKIDFSQLSPEQIEEQMRLFYQQMQAGKDPTNDDGRDGAAPPSGDKSK